MKKLLTVLCLISAPASALAWAGYDVHDPMIAVQVQAPTPQPLVVATYEPADLTDALETTLSENAQAAPIEAPDPD